MHRADVLRQRIEAAAPTQPEQAGRLTKEQARAILDMALDLEKTGRIVSLSEGQERSDYVARNRNIQCALEDYLRNLTEAHPPAQPADQSAEVARLREAVEYFMRSVENHSHLDNLRGGTMGSAWDKLHAALKGTP